MDELIKDFIIEVTEGLSQLDSELVKLESNPNDEELLRNIFRIIHTIKGTCGFLNLPKLESITHATENVLSKLRDKVIEANKNVISTILEAVDCIKTIMTHIESTGTESDYDIKPLVLKLNSLINNSIPLTNIQEEKSLQSNTNIQNSSKTLPTSVALEIDDAIMHGLKVTEEVIEPTHRAGYASIRVNLNLLENIMQTVSELVLTRNQLLQLTRANQENFFSTPIQRLDILTSELQDKVMKTRMQPISNAWVQFPRMVRDLSLELNKKIHLKMLGGETELDRQLIEAIKDPLIHMVRNAASHGIEDPGIRLHNHKPEHGTITLNAYHQGGHIVIEVSDDGKGLDIDKIKAKILQNSLLTESEMNSLTEQQISKYIFRPGFSTAENVTSVSGRGVGMDVVKSNISSINGTISLQYVKGEGSKFIIKIPLTLAIIPILIIECSNEKFGIPQINIIEIVRAGPKLEHKIEYINNKQVLRLRQAILPLLLLSDILHLPQQISDTVFIVICEVGGYNFGVIVNKIHGTEEIVVKPMVPMLRSLSIYFGATLLGDGNVIMIIDPNGLAKLLDNLDINDHNQSLDDQELQNNEEDSSITSFLLFKDFNDLQKAVPIEFITRLEEIDVTQITYSGNRPLIPYNNELMYLAQLDSYHTIPNSGEQPVIVFSTQDKIMGLITKEIIDIITHPMPQFTPVIQDPNHNILGTLIIKGITTDLIDVSKYFYQIFGQEYNAPVYNRSSEEKKLLNILLVDNSPFFRKFIVSILTHHGYKVTSVDHPSKALELLSTENKFGLIIIDSNTFEFSDESLPIAYKNFAQINHAPVIILSSTHVSNLSFMQQDNNIKTCIYKTNHTQLLKFIEDTITNKSLLEAKHE
ncbi:Chemotaxis protein CheA [Rickettsiales bacterium Ac37b]|nr:Chemotaxis protein CheA [Rickettsiales bacterium Ac37b]